MKYRVYEKLKSALSKKSEIHKKIAMNRKIRLAVYGTLRKGFGNYEVYLKNEINDGKAKFIGKGKTLNKYTMYCSGIPFVIEGKETSNIMVEVYEINDNDVVRRIDILEGHPYVYRRKIVPIVLDNGKIIDAWLYFYIANDLEDYEMIVVESGDYADYRYEVI